MLESSSLLKQVFFKGVFLEVFKKVFRNFLNSSSGRYMTEAVFRRYSIKQAFSPNTSSFIKKETPAQVILWEFYKHFQNIVLQNTSRRLVLICNFHRGCFSIEDNCSWLTLMATVNQIVITKVVTNYKTTF